MKITLRDRKIYMDSSSKSEYHRLSIGLAVLFLYAAPFVSQWLAAPAFLICLYRVIRYDAKSFTVDYCILLPISALMKLPNGTPLAIYLSLIASIWYFVRGGLRVSGYMLVGILALLNYLLTRMQMNINDFVLLFGQMFVIFVLISKQNSASAERAVKGFCVSLLISSAYAYLFRNTSALAGITGMNDLPMYGTSLHRFCGLAGDPNYYMTFVIVAIALILKLWDARAISRTAFLLQIIGLSLSGVITYSKAFLLLYIMTIGIYVLWQYWDRKLLKGVFFTVLALVALVVLLTAENSPFAVIVNRLTSAQNLKDLTTGRTRIFAVYWEAITSNLLTFFFGMGMAAEALYRDPHMVYLEMVYYLGLVGTVLLVMVYINIFPIADKKCTGLKKQHLISKYIVLVLVLVAFFSLHGIFTQMFHGERFLAAMGLMVTGKKMENVEA